MCQNDNWLFTFCTLTLIITQIITLRDKQNNLESNWSKWCCRMALVKFNIFGSLWSTISSSLSVRLLTTQPTRAVSDVVKQNWYKSLIEMGIPVNIKLVLSADVCGFLGCSPVCDNRLLLLSVTLTIWIRGTTCQYSLDLNDIESDGIPPYFAALPFQIFTEF